MLLFLRTGMYFLKAKGVTFKNQKEKLKEEKT
jgi:hypothetical protein